LLTTALMSSFKSGNNVFDAPELADSVSIELDVPKAQQVGGRYLPQAQAPQSSAPVRPFDGSAAARRRAYVPPPEPQTSSAGTRWIILGGGVLAVLLLAAILVGRWVMNLAADGQAMAQAGIAAPGAQELRDQVGCDTALVIGNQDMAKFAGHFGQGGQSMRVVTCMIEGTGKAAPTCTDVATTYVTAASPAEPFMAIVLRKGNRQPVCQHIYGPDGRSRQ